jgi:hypothetical protein
MPPKSRAQRRFGYAAAEGKVPGVPKSVGVKFEGHGLKGLPERVKPPTMAMPSDHPKMHTPKHN